MHDLGMNSKKLLLLEDDIYYAQSLKNIFGPETITHVSTLEAARELINRKTFDLYLIDLYRGDHAQGLDLLKDLEGINKPKIILTTSESEEDISQVYKLGGSDYYIKGNERQLEKKLHILLNTPKNNLQQLTPLLNKEELRKLYHPSPKLPLLLLGETGTGKSRLAKDFHKIHFKSKPFIEVNCSNFSEALFESELFGHKRGSFTGAHSDTEGLLSKANGGVLFLDEVGSLSPSLQSKLLKVLEEKTFYPLGSNKKQQSDFYLICATCDPLNEMRANGKIREDFYQRIQGKEIFISPVREKPQIVIPFIQNLINSGKRKFILSDEAKEVLGYYAWPGNLREIHKCAELIKEDSPGLISPRHLPNFLYSTNDILFPTSEIYLRARQIGLPKTLEEIQYMIINLAKQRNEGKVTKVLKELKLSTNTYYKTQKRSEISL